MSKLLLGHVLNVLRRQNKRLPFAAAGRRPVAHPHALRLQLRRQTREVCPPELFATHFKAEATGCVGSCFGFTAGLQVQIPDPDDHFIYPDEEESEEELDPEEQQYLTFKAEHLSR